MCAFFSVWPWGRSPVRDYRGREEGFRGGFSVVSGEVLCLEGDRGS
jgi:hypothetical protein